MIARSVEADRLGHDSEAIAGFLPLVDVLLAVLCVTLMAVGAARVLQVPVALPADHGRPATAPDDAVAVRFDGAGAVSIDGVPASIEGLAAEVRKLGPGRALLVVGDGDASYAQAARVLHRLREAGATDVRLVLRAERAPTR